MIENPGRSRRYGVMSRLNPELQCSNNAAECTAPDQRSQHPAHIVQRAEEFGGDQRDAGDDRELHQLTVGARQLVHGGCAPIHGHVGGEDRQPEQAEDRTYRVSLSRRVVATEQGLVRRAANANIPIGAGGHPVALIGVFASAAFLAATVLGLHSLLKHRVPIHTRR